MTATFTDDERREYRDEKRKEAEERLDALLTQEGWATWLRLRKNLYQFSWSNQVLIAVQAFERELTPTVVKAAGRWKRDGYHPAKGSKALYVWVFKTRRRKNGSWSCCERTLQEEHRCARCGRADHYFQLGPVFDASDVRSFETGEPPVIELPEGEPIVGDELGWLIGPLAKHALDSGWIGSAMLTCHPDHGEGGSWSLRGRELRVCLYDDAGELVPENKRLRVLIHELAHARGITSKPAIDHMSTAAEPKLTYADAEVAVECVSYIVASRVGLDTSTEAIPYMAGWGGETVREKVRTLAALIDRTARELEEPILKLLAHRGEAPTSIRVTAERLHDDCEFTTAETGAHRRAADRKAAA